jgi:hypothetical protein
MIQNPTSTQGSGLGGIDFWIFDFLQLNGLEKELPRPN